MSSLPRTTDLIDTDEIRIRPLTGSVGVSLTGIDLTSEITSDDADALRSALYHNCVLVVPGQFLEPADHMRLAEVFGEPFLPHYYAANALDAYPRIAVVPNFGKERAPAESWHTDWSHMSIPAHGVGCPRPRRTRSRRRHHVHQPVRRLRAPLGWDEGADR